MLATVALLPQGDKIANGIGIFALAAPAIPLIIVIVN